MLQINKLLMHELASIINEEVPLENGLITITKISCSSDLRNAMVSISVIPENNSGTALSNLRKKNRIFSGLLKKKLTLKFIPNFKWKIDSQVRYANDLNDAITKIENQEK